MNVSRLLYVQLFDLIFIYRCYRGVGGARQPTPPQSRASVSSFEIPTRCSVEGSRPPRMPFDCPKIAARFL